MEELAREASAMRGSVIVISLAVFVLVVALPTSTFAVGPGAGGHGGPGSGLHPGSGSRVPFGFAPHAPRPMTPMPLGIGLTQRLGSGAPFRSVIPFATVTRFGTTTPFGNATPGWGWLGSPSAASTSPSGFALTPFHTPYAAPFWGSTAANLAMKPDEATVLQSESRMEEQIRGLEAQNPQDDDSDKSSDASSDDDKSEWEPL